jgi:hypothetical protein
MNYGIVNVKYFSIGILYLSLLIIPIGTIYLFSKVWDKDSAIPYISIHCFTLSLSYLYFMEVLTVVSNVKITMKMSFTGFLSFLVLSICILLILKFIKNRKLSHILSIICLALFCISILLFIKELLFFSLWNLLNTFIIGEWLLFNKEKYFEMLSDSTKYDLAISKILIHLFFIIILFVVSVTIFGNHIYESVKSSFGGGAPVNVTLSFKPEIVTTGSFKELLDSSTVCDSKKLQLYDHSNGYLLLKKESTFYHIKDDYVVMIKK